ncbi:MAG: dTDP-4-dehydrorhamnose 3,5-epimerase [Acidimicrobiaceae bacterium]|nr:dTDP-4-dehydrorhamnose 3,5-epimerase [Acidimicrobiaceae bacterium]
MPSRVRQLVTIADAFLVYLEPHVDSRGFFVETYRSEWFPSGSEMVQANRCDRHAGCVVGLHYHLRQSDYWYVPYGTIRVVLHDLRMGSPTEGNTWITDLGTVTDFKRDASTNLGLDASNSDNPTSFDANVKLGGKPRPNSKSQFAHRPQQSSKTQHAGVYIPPGVAHGFASLTDTTVIYLVDAYYDPADELGVAWNDPEIAADWGISRPLLSDRDQANPHKSAILDHLKPYWQDRV